MVLEVVEPPSNLQAEKMVVEPPSNSNETKQMMRQFANANVVNQMDEKNDGPGDQAEAEPGSEALVE